MLKSSHFSKTRQAFTLIDLLVVIAIIAILAAILFPVFARARENARRSSCQSNEKQLGLAIMQYTQDYDERMPITAYGIYGYDYFLVPYVSKLTSGGSSPGIYACPSDFVKRSGTNKSRTYSMIYNSAAAAATSGKSAGQGGRTLSSIPAPAETFLLAEKPYGLNYPTTNQFAAVESPIDQMQQPGLAEPLHFEGWNYLFCDGHVKWYKPEQTIDTNPSDGITGQMDVYSATSYPRGYWTVSETD